MLGNARAGASEVSSHGSGEQLGGPFLAFGGRHRRLAGARLGGGSADQRECSGLRMGAYGGLYQASRHRCLGFTTPVMHIWAERPNTVWSWPLRSQH